MGQTLSKPCHNRAQNSHFREADCRQGLGVWGDGSALLVGSAGLSYVPAYHRVCPRRPFLHMTDLRGAGAVQDPSFTFRRVRVWSPSGDSPIFLVTGTRYPLALPIPLPWETTGALLTQTPLRVLQRADGSPDPRAPESLPGTCRRLWAPFCGET